MNFLIINNHIDISDTKDCVRLINQDKNVNYFLVIWITSTIVRWSELSSLTTNKYQNLREKCPKKVIITLLMTSTNSDQTSDDYHF